MDDTFTQRGGERYPAVEPLCFRGFVLDRGRRELSREDQPIPMERKAFDILAYLAEHPGRVVSKQELIDQIWEGRAISESVIPQAAGKARRALGEHSDWITTVHGVGYRFTAPVEKLSIAPATVDTKAGKRRSRARWLALPFALLAAVALVFGLSRTIIDRGPESPPRIAVLPFVSLSSNSELDYFGDGMAEELLHALAAFGDLQVASRTSSFGFRSLDGASLDARKIGRELNVNYLVDGSVRLESGQFRMSVRLTDAETGYQVWSGLFDGPWNDILTTQRSLTRAIIEQIRPQLLPQYAVGPGAPADPEAYQLYLRGRHLWHQRDSAALEEAMTLFRRAANLQPDFAMAYTGLAECLLTLAVYGDLSPDEAHPAARELLDRALQLAPDRAETRMALGNLHALRTRWNEAEEELLTAVALNPSLAMAHMSLGNVHNEQGRIDEAYRRFRIAFVLDPLHATIALNLAQASLRLGLDERAAIYLDRANELAPAHTFLFGFRTVLHVSTGDTSALRRQLDEWLATRTLPSENPRPDNLNRHIACAMASARLDRAQQVIDCIDPLLDDSVRTALGAQYLLLALNHSGWAKVKLGDPTVGLTDFRQALAAAERLRQGQPASEILAYEHALALAGLQRLDEASTMLEESVRLGRRDLGMMRHDPRLDALRGRSDFQTIMAQLTAEQSIMRTSVLQVYPEPGV